MLLFACFCFLLVSDQHLSPYCRHRHRGHLRCQFSLTSEPIFFSLSAWIEDRQLPSNPAGFQHQIGTAERCNFMDREAARTLCSQCADGYFYTFSPYCVSQSVNPIYYLFTLEE